MPINVSPIAVCLCVALAPSVARAQGQHAPAAPDRSRSEAVRHYDLGRGHYASGHYRLAARELETAFGLDPAGGANLLFNLGAVYERMGDIDRASRAYAQYLSRTPEAEERERTERILRRLRGASVELSSMRRRRGRADGLFFLTTGAALTSTAIGVTWLATQDGTELEPAPVAFTVTGVALGVLATVLYFAREAPAASTAFADGPLR